MSLVSLFYISHAIFTELCTFFLDINRNEGKTNDVLMFILVYIYIANDLPNNT